MGRKVLVWGQKRRSSGRRCSQDLNECILPKVFRSSPFSSFSVLCLPIILGIPENYMGVHYQRSLFLAHHVLRNIVRDLKKCELLSVNPILSGIYAHNWGWSNLPLFNSFISLDSWHPCSPKQHSCSPPRLLWSPSVSLALHFTLQRFSQNMPIVLPQHIPVQSEP